MIYILLIKLRKRTRYPSTNSLNCYWLGGPSEIDPCIEAWSSSQGILGFAVTSTSTINKVDLMEFIILNRKDSIKNSGIASYHWGRQLPSLKCSRIQIEQAWVLTTLCKRYCAGIISVCNSQVSFRHKARPSWFTGYRQGYLKITCRWEVNFNNYNMK